MKWMKLNPRIPRACVGRGFVRMLSAAVVAMQLVACGGGGGGSGSGSAAASAAGGTVSAAGAGASSSGGTTSPSGAGQAGTGTTGSLTLSWVAPATRADGSPLSLADIDGFRIHYGNSAGEYTQSVNITDATAQQVVLKNLASGTYYLVMTTYDVDGRESGYSAVVKKTVS